MQDKRPFVPSPVTAMDVAKVSGVSQAAVSRAFTPGASIAPQTRERILQAAQSLGYHPNQIARSLTRGSSSIVGVAVGNLHNPFFAESLEVLTLALESAGLRLLLFHMSEGQAEPSVGDVLHYRLDALILLSVSLSSTLVEQCRRANVPVVLYNRTTAVPTASSVVGSNVQGARAIAAHLLGGGHARFAFLAGHDSSSTSRERENGFTAFLSEHGHGLHGREIVNFDFNSAASATRRLLSSPNPPDAIFCVNDAMAIAAINVARHEFGIDVGRQMSIVGFDNIAMAAWPAFSLTTFTQPAVDMVARTVEIVRKVRGDPQLRVNAVVQGQLIVRGSSRPVDPVLHRQPKL
ncbi:LacI family DNA-binding transcriptional regulator [Aquisediminimonas profunda]|uniref:LacI family DNA-binding transcriptional regulator n=1 Tax=Aquisediminimonas profunda TaxID=1550733 RepID=UPI001C63119D|nr:LacI family DNA-binding transcriptional regulator [Aquisediminimonas profunda]